MGHVITFIVQGIHDQGELLKEVYTVFWTAERGREYPHHAVLQPQMAYFKTESWYAVMVALGLKSSAVSLATSTLGRPTCFF